MDNKFFQESTNAYIVAYNTAMEQMRNPSAAEQVATAVTMTYMIMLKSEMQQAQQQQDIGMNILNMIAAAAADKQGSQEDGEDSEKG